MRVSCSHCGKRYKLPAKFENKKVRCKACEQTFRVQDSDQPQKRPSADSLTDSLPTAIEAPGPDDMVVASVVDEDGDLPVAQEALMSAVPVSQADADPLGIVNPLPVPPQPSYTPTAPRKISRREKLTGAKQRERAGRKASGADLDPAEKYCIDFGYTLIVMGVGVNFMNIFGFTLRRLRRLGEYGPPVGLGMAFLGAILVVYGYQSTSPRKGAVVGLLSLSLAAVAFSCNMMFSGGGGNVGARSMFASDTSGSNGQLAVTPNRDPQPPKLTDALPSYRSTNKPKKPSSPLVGNRRPNRAAPGCVSPGRVSPGGGLPPVMEEALAQNRIHEIFRRHNENLQRLMVEDMGIRHRFEFPEERLTDAIGSGFGSTSFYVHPFEKVMLGIAVCSETRRREKVIRDVAPLYEGDIRNGSDILEHGEVAKDGYAVYSISILGGNKCLYGVQVQFAKFTDGKYDPSDTYNSKWFINEPSNADDAQVVGGTGEPVQGIYGHKIGLQRSLGLIVDR